MIYLPDNPDNPIYIHSYDNPHNPNINTLIQKSVMYNPDNTNSPDNTLITLTIRPFYADSVKTRY